MDKLLTGLLFSQKQTEQIPQAPPGTIIIDTSFTDGYMSMDCIGKTTYNRFVKDYSRFQISDNIIINITSMGGDIFYALLIGNIINKHKGIVVANIDRYCMGGAVLIALSCNYIRMKPSACLGYMNFYNSYIPIDKVHGIISGLENNDSIPSYIKPFLVKIETNLSINRNETINQITRLLRKNYDPESINKIINFFYTNNTAMNQLFMDDIPKFINVVYDGEENDNHSIDSDNNGDSLD